MAKDINDIKTKELQLVVSTEQARALRNAIDLQVKSHMRASRAQRVAGREAIADTLEAEARKLEELIRALTPTS